MHLLATVETEKLSSFFSLSGEEQTNKTYCMYILIGDLKQGMRKKEGGMHKEKKRRNGLISPSSKPPSIKWNQKILFLLNIHWDIRTLNSREQGRKKCYFFFSFLPLALTIPFLYIWHTWQTNRRFFLCLCGYSITDIVWRKE